MKIRAKNYYIPNMKGKVVLDQTWLLFEFLTIQTIVTFTDKKRTK